MIVEPIGDRVLVRIVEAENTTPSGIVLPDTAKEKPHHGIVVAVGESQYDDPLPVEEGDKVMFAQYSGTEIELDGKPHLILEITDILAKIRE